MNPIRTAAGDWQLQLLPVLITFGERGADPCLLNRGELETSIDRGPRFSEGRLIGFGTLLLSLQ